MAIIKTLLFLFFFFTFSFLAYSQDYISLISEDATWGIREEGGDGNGFEYLNVSNYHFLGDTIISDTLYKKLFRDTLYLGGIREEGTQVFYRPAFFKDRLIYDFGMSIGDTITLECGRFACKSLVVLNVDTLTLEDGLPRKRQKMLVISNYFEPVNYEVDWIAGIGSQQSLIEDDFCYFSDLEKLGPTCSQRLLCFSINGEMLYTNSDTLINECPPPLILSSAKKQFLKDFKVNIFPNPAFSLLHYEIQASKKGIDLLEIQLIDAFGHRIFTNKTNKLSGQIDTHQLSKGFYVLVFKLAQGISSKKIIKN